MLRALLPGECMKWMYIGLGRPPLKCNVALLLNESFPIKKRRGKYCLGVSFLSTSFICHSCRRITRRHSAARFKLREMLEQEPSDFEPQAQLPADAHTVGQVGREDLAGGQGHPGLKRRAEPQARSAVGGIIIIENEFDLDGVIEAFRRQRALKDAVKAL